MQTAQKEQEQTGCQKGGKKEEKGEGENEKTDTVTLSDVNDVNLTVRTVPLSSA